MSSILAQTLSYLPDKFITAPSSTHNTKPIRKIRSTIGELAEQLLSKQPPFTVDFEGEPVHHNLTKDTEYTSSPVSAPDDSSSRTKSSRIHVELMADLSTLDFRWASSKKSGRPHQHDTRELELSKDERIKVVRNMGRDWYMAANENGTTGWVHGSWIKFEDDKVYQAAKPGYTRFMEDLDKLLIPGELQKFPEMKSYVDECTRPECSAQKQDASSLGICVHDLQVLLNGSGRFSYEWLKTGRNLWHPDRFARFCHLEAVERLRPLCEQMFVMYGMLMEECRR